jgi:uncharacterized protein YjbI with pentapeptide repeats
MHPAKDFSWSFWFALPIYPFSQRRTIRKEVVKDTIWTFDQLQGIFYVVVPIRMTVVKLDAGGLLVYAPVAPTPECIRLVDELVAEHGDVKYIILPTISGLEHKVFVGPFARYFRKAQVFVAPKQWSFQLDLPLSWLGIPAKRTSVLPADSKQTPFASEFEYAILGPIELGLGKFAEVAFFHKKSRTLLVTDIVVSVPEQPSAIVQLDPYPLLFHAKDNAADLVLDEQGLLEDWPQERAIAEGRTAAIFSSVDGSGKAKIIRFLSRSKLLTPLQRDLRLGRAILNGNGGYAEDRLYGVRVIDLGVMLAGADLSGTDLRWTDLSDANLVRANLSQCDLVKTNLARTILYDAKLIGADFKGTRLFYGAAETASPRSRTHPPNYQTGEYTGAVVEDADFTDVQRMSDSVRNYCCAWGGEQTRATIPGGCEGIANKLDRQKIE